MLDEIALIPAYEPNEKLISLVEKLKKNNFNIVVVDDGSGSEYKNIFEECKKYAKVISYDENKGKGYALKLGIKDIYNNYKDYVVVTIDSDGQHKVEDAEKLIQYSIKNPDELVLGKRSRDDNVPLRSRLGNEITRAVFKLITKSDIYDTQTGLRSFTNKIVDRLLNIPGERYEYEMNVLLECTKSNIKISEIGIETIYIENNATSHFNTIKDSIKIYKDIIKFCLSSLMCFFIDYILYSAFILTTNNIFVSNICARIISSMINFSVNKNIVFKSKKSTILAGIQYFSLAIIVLLFNTLILNVLVNFLMMNPMIAKILTELVLFIVSWTVQNKLIFKK